MGDRWLTGNTLNTPNEYWRVLIPSDDWVRQALLGALLQLSEVENWEKFGTVTEDQIASAFNDILDSFEPQPIVSGGNELIKISDNTPIGSDNFIQITMPNNGYVEFLIKSFGGSNSGAGRLILSINGDTNTANYSGVTQSQASFSNNVLIGRDVSGNRSYGELRLLQPHSTTQKKQYIALSSWINTEYLNTLGYWNNTNAISTVRLTSNIASVVSGFRLELWGLPI